VIDQMSEVYLSRDGISKLQEELKELKTSERPIVRASLQRAREFGDLSENAEYAAAKERLMFLEQRINRLEETLSRAVLLENENIPDDKVYIGATVQLQDLAKSGELTYTLVSPEEADFEEGKISTVSPIGKGLLGKEEGDEVEITVPAGTLHYKVLKITRD
jgi:transcription elongation factor GreA